MREVFDKYRAKSDARRPMRVYKLFEMCFELLPLATLVPCTHSV